MSVTFKIENGKDFERLLNKIKDLKRTSTASSTIYSAIKKSQDGVTETIKQMTPKSTGAKGWRKYDSRNHVGGTLRDSVKSGLRKRVKGRNIFMGAMFYEDSYKQYYAGFLLNKHEYNAFGFGGGKNVMKEAIDKSRPIALNTLEQDLMTKLTKKLQKIIDKG